MIALAVAIALQAPAAKAGDAAAQAAFERGDYVAAEAAWRPLAEKGKVDGEFGLGEVYEQGKGDYRRAQSWYEKAARQGSTEALYRLALIAAAGNSDTPPDPVKAYKWALLASNRKDDEWGQLADDLRRLLEQHTSAEEQAEGRKEADAWRNPKPQVAAVVPTPPVVAPPIPPAAIAAPHGSNGCTPPGWPGPPLPCGANPLPAIPGTQALAAPPIAPAPGAPPPDRRALNALAAAIKQIDCASLRDTTDAQGRPEISGTVPDEAERAKLVRVSNRLMPEAHPEFHIDVVPPPLCRSLLAISAMQDRDAGPKQLEAKLAGNPAVLREGDPINIDVKAPDYPVYLRIDYFSLDHGQVLHMLPAKDRPADLLGAGARGTFGPWGVGGAPFGTEFIAVVATPEALDLGKRPNVEPAAGYIADLDRALRRGRDRARPNLVTTLLVRTKAKQ